MLINDSKGLIDKITLHTDLQPLNIYTLLTFVLFGVENLI